MERYRLLLGKTGGKTDCVEFFVQNDEKANSIRAIVEQYADYTKLYHLTDSGTGKSRRVIFKEVFRKGD